MFFGNFTFIVSHFKNSPSWSIENFERFDVIVVKKKSLLKVYNVSLFLYSNSC